MIQKSSKKNKSFYAFKAIMMTCTTLLTIASILPVKAGVVAINQENNVQSSVKNASQEEMAQTIWKIVHENGGTDAGAAALLGNLDVESQLKADNIQNQMIFEQNKALNPNIEGYGIGLAQLDGERRTNFLLYSQNAGVDWREVYMQLDYLLNKEGNESELIGQLIQEENLTNATKYIMELWERAGNKQSLNDRVQAALKWFNLLTSSQYETNSSPLVNIPEGWEINQPVDTDSYTTESYDYKQCTWWAYNRAKDFGISYGLYMGSGASWQKQPGYEVTTIPTLHSVISFNAGEIVGGQWQANLTYGHVAFVEAIHPDGSILISQSGTGFNDLFNFQVISASDASRLHYVIGH